MSRLYTRVHALLSLLEAELAQQLAPLVAQLGRALGTYPAHPGSGHAEPDGYAGIVRAPHYERLLASEWLLAEELPDEFLRRAAEREQAAFALAYSAPRSLRRCLVLLDSGAALLGRPRIALLAALMALEARARAGGVEFEWGGLGSPQRRQAIASKDDARAFLAAHSLWEAQPEDFDPAAFEVDELWLLGAPIWRERARGTAHVMTFLEPWGGGNVEVCVARRGASPRSLALELPPDPVCVRLLRDPFAPEAATLPAPVLAGAPQFAARGARLLALDGPRLVVAHDVPSHAGATPGRARSFPVPAGEALVGATYLDRLRVLTASERELHAYVPARYTTERRAGRPVLNLPMPQTEGLSASKLRPTLLMLGKQELVMLVGLEQGGTLLAGKRRETRGYVLPERLVAGFHAGKAEQAVWLSEKGSSVELCAQTPHEADWRTLLRLPGPAPEQVFFCCPRSAADAYQGYVALRTGERVLLAALRPPGSAMATRELSLPARTKLVGLTLSASQAPLLVVLEPDLSSFSTLGRSEAELLFHAPGSVREATVCPHSPRLAYAGDTHWTLIDLKTKSTLRTLARREEAP